MAGKLRRQFLYAVSPGLCVVTAKIPLGRTGAVGTVDGRGIKSVTRSDVGSLTVNFNDKYLGMVSVQGILDANQGSAVANTGADGYAIQLAGDWSDNSLSAVNGGDGYCKIETLVGSTGTVADAITCDLLLTFWMKTSEQS